MLLRSAWNNALFRLAVGTGLTRGPDGIALERDAYSDVVLGERLRSKYLSKSFTKNPPYIGRG
jgi:hypothetical protein